MHARMLVFALGAIVYSFTGTALDRAEAQEGGTLILKCAGNQYFGSSHYSKTEFYITIDFRSKELKWASAAPATLEHVTPTAISASRSGVFRGDREYTTIEIDRVSGKTAIRHTTSAKFKDGTPYPSENYHMRCTKATATF